MNSLTNQSRTKKNQGTMDTYLPIYISYINTYLIMGIFVVTGKGVM